MLLGLKPDQLEQWKSSIHAYEKTKRTKHPFGKGQPEIQSNFKNQIQNNSLIFNPVLQTFRDERELSKTLQHEQISKLNEQFKFMKNNYKYSVDYDIINNHPSYSLPERHKSISLSHDSRKKEYLDPTYNDFDIINGKNFEKGIMEKRELKHLKHYQRKIRPKNQNRYNIISGTYQDVQQSRVSSFNGGNSSFNPIACRFSNPEHEELYQQQQQERERAQVRDSQLHLPLSYRIRQPLILDRTVPLSPEIQSLDEKNQKAKERYKQKYQIEEQYKMRNQYDRELDEERAKNRVHNGRVLEAKAREFNILNAQGYHPKRSEQLFRKEADPATYDLKPYAKQSSFVKKSSIKQSGFGTIS